MRRAVVLFIAFFLAGVSVQAYALGLKKSLPANFKSYGYYQAQKNKGHPVRSGNSSMRFEVRAGDCSWSKGWNDCEKDRERHELKSKPMSNGEYWFHWSIYLPKDFKNIYPAKLALGQFHQEGSFVAWMFQNHNGGYTVDNQVIGTTIDTKKILTDEQMRGKWNDILVHVKWSHKNDGYFRVYVNGETKPSYAWVGPTKLKGHRPYFKLGIYRSYVSRSPGPDPTQIVYYDDVERASSCVKATDYFDCKAIINNQSKLPKVSAIKVCDDKLCPDQFDRTVSSLHTRFSCWLEAPSVQVKDKIPTTLEIDAFIENITGINYRLSKAKLIKNGLKKAIVAVHKKDLLRLVNYMNSSEKFCAKPTL